MVSKEDNMINFVCLQTGTITEKEQEFKCASDFRLFVFPETKLFCIEERVYCHMCLTYYPYDESCPFGNKRIHHSTPICEMRNNNGRFYELDLDYES